MEKSGPKMWAISESFNTLLKVNNHPLGDNFAQSGHSVQP
jgi:hypothetical protein